MSAAVASNGNHHGAGSYSMNSEDDPFRIEDSSPRGTPSQITHNPYSLGSTTSPLQVKRSLKAHLLETERRLQETQKLGTSLLAQQEELSEKLRQVEFAGDEEEISPGLRQRLHELEREHENVGREVARALLGPKSRQVSAEEKPDTEAVFSSHIGASPSKASAPNRRQRNQQAGRADDLQFAADISTSLLAQVRQLQAAVAERDESLRIANLEQSRMQQDAEVLQSRLKTLDDAAHRARDESWDMITQKRDLEDASQEAAIREKRLNAALTAALAEKSSAQNDADAARLAHQSLSDEHTAARKAHDSEIHALKRTVDMGDDERTSLQRKVDELTAQNQELAQGLSSRLRNNQADLPPELILEHDQEMDRLDPADESPPPSPSKTPRHGGLESDTLKSSLHHAHRMIQNLKNNIHREKTEKIELKRMLQDARDELEHQRSGSGSLRDSKRAKTKPDALRKGPRLDMLGGSRKSQTDVEMGDEGWEDDAGALSQADSTRNLAIPGAFNAGRLTDVSDAYHTATDNDAAFETADEPQTTESEDFQTGAESLAGDSEDDLTETEGTGVTQRGGTIKGARPLASRAAGDRASYLSTASTSGGEEDDDLQTPIQPKFRLKNGRHSLARQSRLSGITPESSRTTTRANTESPAASMQDRSPPAVEHSLFAELGALDDASSDRYSTPGRGSILSARSTPAAAFSPASGMGTRDITPILPPKPTMVETGMMTEPWEPVQARQNIESDMFFTSATGSLLAHSPLENEQPRLSVSDFPLPPSQPQSPPKHADQSTQWTPRRTAQDSPLRNTNHITPPKTVWDEEAESTSGSPQRTVDEFADIPIPRTPLDFSDLLSQDTMPLSPDRAIPLPQQTLPPHSFSGILSQTSEPVEPVRQPTASQAFRSDRPTTAEKTVATGVTGAALGSMSPTLWSSLAHASQVSETKASYSQGTSVPRDSSTPSRAPLGTVSGNTTPRGNYFTGGMDEGLQTNKPVPYSRNDQSSQTMLTAEQIHQALQQKPVSHTTLPPLALPPGTTPSTIEHPVTPTPAVARPYTSRPMSPPIDAMPPVSPLKRPSSANSQRPPSVQQHPPLPPDHKVAIAKASGRVTPSRESSNASHVATIMGPPTMPASAMRQPRTPAEGSIRSPTKEGLATRGSIGGRPQFGTSNSRISRRSSVSSFASELDERFNIRADEHGYTAQPGTDPRMIQAITQTMIGEYMWKYTHKLGRDEMSDTRHRRYFWVHPYTKTLYWSSNDPQSGKAHNTKGVPIESVRAVTDDNPMPPGLHRKSLEIKTPNKTIKFTAATSQRHETWFNALSYLLLRNEDQGQNQSYNAGGNEITRDDIREFNVGGYGARLVPSGSRVSMSSYNSRTTRGTSINHGTQRQPMPAGVIATHPNHDTVNSQASTVRQTRADQPRVVDQDRTLRAGSISRFSRMLGSVTGRHNRAESHDVQAGPSQSQQGSIYNASVVSDAKDEEEEKRAEMLREQMGTNEGLENVRACCDGKHDVSTLTHGGRHASHASHSHRNSSLHRASPSVSRRLGGSNAQMVPATS